MTEPVKTTKPAGAPLWFVIVFLGILWWAGSKLLNPAPRTLDTIQNIVNNPSGNQPLDGFRRSDTGYNFEYTGTKLGGDILMVWEDTTTWWMQILDSAIKPSNLGCRGDGPCDTKLGTLYLQTTGTEFNIRTLNFVNKYNPGLK